MTKTKMLIAIILLGIAVYGISLIYPPVNSFLTMIRGGIGNIATGLTSFLNAAGNSLQTNPLNVAFGAITASVSTGSIFYKLITQQKQNAEAVKQNLLDQNSGLQSSLGAVAQQKSELEQKLLESADLQNKLLESQTKLTETQTSLAKLQNDYNKLDAEKQAVERIAAKARLIPITSETVH